MNGPEVLKSTCNACEAIGIASQNYLESLIVIKEAVTHIWVENPIIIMDGCDHGIPHCERVISNIESLLNNSDLVLSEEEKYVLLCSAYLHDIGLQFDIKNIACLAHQPDYTIDARSSSISASVDYSANDQKLVRKFHNRLTVAWLFCSLGSHDTALGKAVKSIPTELLLDIGDICQFHTRSDINDCPNNFYGIQSQSKRFLAALLRFADELDFKAGVVNYELIKLFASSTDNEVSWWILRRLSITILACNNIVITASVNKSDFHKVKSGIQYILDTFWDKNLTVISVLLEHEVPLGCTNSEIIVVEGVEDIPDTIAEILVNIGNSSDQQEQMLSGGDHLPIGKKTHRRTICKILSSLVFIIGVLLVSVGLDLLFNRGWGLIGGGIGAICLAFAWIFMEYTEAH